MLDPDAFDLVTCGEQSLDLFMGGLKQLPVAPATD